MRTLINSLKLAAAALFLIAGAHVAQAAPLSLQHVSAEADWLVHIDFEQFHATQLGRRVDERLDQDPKAAAGRAYMQTAMGVDPRTDLLDVTLFGEGVDQDDAVLLVGVAGDLDQFLEFERNRAGSEFRTSQYGEHTLYSSVEPRKNERRYMAIVGRDNGSTAVITRSAATLRTSLDVLDGNAGSAANIKPGAWPAPAPGACFQFVALNLAALVEGKPRSAMFQHMRRTTVQSGENDGQTFLTMTINATDEATAGNMLQALEGLLAMGRLRAQERPELGQLLDAVSVQRQQATVKVDVRLAADQFVQLLERLAARHGH